MEIQSNESDKSSNWIIFIIVFFIIIIIIISIFFIFPFNRTEIQGSCTSTINCRSGLICSNGKCLANIGSPCTSIADCIQSATSCTHGVCVSQSLSGPNGPPPCLPGLIVENNLCKSPLGGSCTHVSDCVSKATNCVDNICIICC